MMSGFASAATSCFSFWPFGFMIHRARSRTKAIRLVEDHESDVAFASNNVSVSVSTSTENVSEPRVNAILPPSGRQAGKVSGSGVCVICWRAPVDVSKIHRSPETMTANRIPSGAMAASVSIPSISARRVSRGTSSVR